MRSAAADVFQAARRYIPPSLPDYDSAIDAAVQYQAMALKALERRDPEQYQRALRSLHSKALEIERTWRR